MVAAAAVDTPLVVVEEDSLQAVAVDTRPEEVVEEDSHQDSVQAVAVDTRLVAAAVAFPRAEVVDTRR